MNKKIKLTLAGAGFLGSNGALIPVINNNFSIPTFSLSNLGGGISHRNSQTQKSYETPKINLKNAKSTMPHLDLDSSKSFLQTPKLNLEEQGESSMQISSNLSPKIEDSSFSSSIEKIHTEIAREDRVQGIEQSLEKQYQEQFKRQLESTSDKQQNHLKNYQEAKKLIHSSSQQEPAQARSRGKREAIPEKEPLTQVQRDSILRMFNLHYQLKKESQKLTERLESEFFNGLRELLNPAIQSTLKSSAPKVEEIQTSLRDIGWTHRTIKTQRDRSRRSTRFFDPKSWGEWSQNPFRHFFKEEKEFTGAISTQQKLAQRAELAEQMQLRMQSGYRGQFLDQYQSNMQRIQKQKESTGSHIEHKIASKLLEYMGQVLSST